MDGTNRLIPIKVGDVYRVSNEDAAGFGSIFKIIRTSKHRISVLVIYSAKGHYKNKTYSVERSTFNAENVERLSDDALERILYAS